MLILTIILGCVAVALLVTCALLAQSRRTLQRDHEQAREQNRQLQDENKSFDQELNTAQQTVAKLEEKVAGFDQRLADQRQAHDDAQAKAREQFQALSAEALERANTQFLKLANERFDSKQKDASTELDQRKLAIDAMLKPIRESLDKQAKAVTEMEQKRERAYGQTDKALEELFKAQNHLQQHTTALTATLRGSSSYRGTWGEITLRRVVELADLKSYCDFDEQVTIWKGDDRQKPDMVVRLPNGRNIVVDAKSSGASLLEANLEDKTDQERHQLIEAHANHLQSRVNELAKKAYTQSLEGAIDFVVLFVPSDGLLEAATRVNRGFMDDALQSKVVVATPNTLFAVLKAVYLAWSEQESRENADQIITLGKHMHSRVATLLEHTVKLGKAVDSTVKQYNAMVGSLERNILPQTRRFEEFKATEGKSLEDPKPVDRQARELKAAELEAIDHQPRKLTDPETTPQQVEVDE